MKSIDNKEKKSKNPSGFGVIVREFSKDKVALASLIIFVGIVLFVIGFQIYSRVTGVYESYFNVDIFNRFLAPGEDGYLLGTDTNGRSVAVWLVLGIGNSILIAMLVTFITVTIGTIVGLIISYYGGVVDNVVMRIIDFLIIIPYLMIIIVFVSLVRGYGIFTFIMILSAFAWMGTTRLIRAKALSESKRDYVLASKTMGTKDLTIIFREILPNIGSLVIVEATLTLAANMGIEVGLTFLGFGLPIGTPSIGTLLSYARDADVLANRINIWLPAALIVLLLMLCINYIGQAIKRAVDARQRS